MSYLSEVYNKRQLYSSWFAALKNPKVASGVDGTTVKEFGYNISQNLKSINKDLKNRSYVFNKIRTKKIRKKTSNKKRQIHIYTIRDKIVQRALLNTLLKNRRTGMLFPEIFNSVGVAYLPRRNRNETTGVKLAVQKTEEYYRNGFTTMTCCDIESFFDKINRAKLQQKISKKMGDDDSIDWLLSQCIHPEIIQNDIVSGEISLTSSGVKQGSILAPFFSNIYLSEFDNAIQDIEEVKAIRYADDLAIFTRSKTEASKTWRKIDDLLFQKSGLRFYQPGTKKPPKHYDLNQYGEYLGISLSKTEKPNITFIKLPIASKVKELKEKITRATHPNRQSSFARTAIDINRSLSSWFSFYKEVGCQKRSLKPILNEVYEHYVHRLNDLLKTKGIIKSSLSLEKLQYLGLDSKQSFRL